MRNTKFITGIIAGWLLLLPFWLNAQKYISLPVENAYWTVSEMIAIPGSYETFLYTVKGDTMLNDKLYDKIYKLSQIPDSPDTLWTLHSFMRQDIDQKKVWFIRHYRGENAEKTGYNFDVNVGDTVCLPAFDFGIFENGNYTMYGDSLFVVEQAKTTASGNAYYFNSVSPGSSYNLQVFEGVGDLGSPIPNLVYHEGLDQSMLKCLEVEGLLVYGTEGFCGFPVAIDELPQELLKLSISPNPCNNELSIAFSNNPESDVELRLFNLYGKLMYRIEMPSRQMEYKLNTSDMTNGIYFLQLKTKINSSISRRFIIQH
ncbi:MAG: T9SS type A sorting domain-containing protein [Bacteroidales bacterium]|nr:T9SS type A sorting domain-containing protein [Bacteroidales bacterium]